MAAFDPGILINRDTSFECRSLDDSLWMDDGIRTNEKTMCLQVRGERPDVEPGLREGEAINGYTPPQEFLEDAADIVFVCSCVLGEDREILLWNDRAARRDERRLRFERFFFEAEDAVCPYP